MHSAACFEDADAPFARIPLLRSNYATTSHWALGRDVESQGAAVMLRGASGSSSGSSEQSSKAATAALTAIGIVYGNLGTSPLYTLQTAVQAVGGHFDAQTALGVLSLIIWTLIITISIKYCLFVMREDNHGEGGILALMSLVGANSFQRGTRYSP